MSFIEKYFKDIESKVRTLIPQEIENYLLSQGYYPDRYVLPPSFCVKKFKLNKKPIHNIKKYVSWLNTEDVIFPKNAIMDRVFGIIHPDIYHDLVYYISKDWETITNTLFKDRKIYCYSFPLPVEQDLFSNSRIKRTERMIYDYIEMAEKDLVADSLGFDYIIHADIKNFYPSVYTHSLSWAIHGKEFIQTGKNSRGKKNLNDYTLIGNILDKLIQCGNGGSTNGIPIGSIVSDILAELVLADIDTNVSNELEKQGIEFKGVRYKDDYRILCKDEESGKKILKILQKFLFRYNLSLHDGKSHINKFPEGLYRPWIIEYKNYKTIKGNNEIMSFKQFEVLYFNILNIDKKYFGTGILKKLLGEIISKDNKILIHIENRKNALKFLNLIWHIRKEKIDSLPQILGIFELLLTTPFIDSSDIKTVINNEINLLYKSKETLGTYEIIWLSYFIKSNKIGFSGKNPLKGSKNKIFKSINSNKNFLFGNLSKSKSKAKIFTNIEESKINYPFINDWVGLFK